MNIKQCLMSVTRHAFARVLCTFVLLVMTAMVVNAQTLTVSGTVTDPDGEPMIGATVVVQGTQNGAATDLDGNYSLKNVPSTAKLRISYVGYKTEEVAVAGKNVVNVVLQPEASMLDEVVAIGYAKVRRKDLTASTASVGGKELAQIPVSSAAQALTGKAAGVNVITQNGAPGADINITVRGGTTLTQGAEPLYIVDGFQMENGLRNVDINDIETIDVMKDASATAIYGSAGANGVILITTKSGQSGKTNINYNGFVSFTRLGKKIDVLNPEEYVKYQYEFNQLRGNIDSWTRLFGGNVNDPDFYTGAYSRIERDYRNREGIDWQDEVFGKTGVTQNHNVSITGGTDKSNFMVSYNYIGEDGIMKKHNYEKNSVRAKIRQEMFNCVRFDFAASLQDTKTEGGGSLGGTLKHTILQPVTGGNLWTNDELLNKDLTDFFAEMPGSTNYDANNPILNNNAITNEKHHRMASVNAGLEIDIIKGLTFRTAGSYMWQQIRTDYWDDGSTKQAKTNLSPYGYGYRNNEERSNWQITNTLNYNFNLNKVHDFTVLLGQETAYWNTLKMENEYREFPDGNFGLNDVNMGKPFTWTSDKSRVGLVSVFGRVSYNYDDRYLINATLRADGSSKFARGNKWDWFPSVSAAWRISQEKFMESTRDWLQNLKLRAGYGVAGNNKIDNNMYATDYGSGHYASNGSDFITFVPGTVLGNAALVWEKTKTYNVAVDASLFNSRVNLSVDWYNNQSDNLLIKNKIPSSTGYSEQFQNLGSIRNRGVEIVLNTVNIATRDFTWTMDFNIAFNRSKVLSLYGGEDDKMPPVSYDQIAFLVEAGKPVGQFYGLKYDGVYTTDDFDQLADGTYMLKDGVPYRKGSNRNIFKPGDVKYVCTAGETDDAGNPVFSVNDRTVIGNANPKFTGGWNNTFTYRGFDLTVFMNFSYGNKVYNLSNERFYGPYMPNENTIQVMANRFKLVDPLTGKETTDLARLAELNPGNQRDMMWSVSEYNKNAITDYSSYFLEDGSFLRINNITLGYTIPKKITSKAKISNLRVYGTVNNLHTFTNYSGYDPEVSVNANPLTPGIDNSSFPRAKSWVVGLNLTF